MCVRTCTYPGRKRLTRPTHHATLSRCPTRRPLREAPSTEEGQVAVAHGRSRGQTASSAVIRRATTHRTRTGSAPAVRAAARARKSTAVTSSVTCVLCAGVNADVISVPVSVWWDARLLRSSPSHPPIRSTVDTGYLTDGVRAGRVAHPTVGGVGRWVCSIPRSGAFAPGVSRVTHRSGRLTRSSRTLHRRFPNRMSGRGRVVAGPHSPVRERSAL